MFYYFCVIVILYIHIHNSKYGIHAIFKVVR